MNRHFQVCERHIKSQETAIPAFAKQPSRICFHAVFGLTGIHAAYTTHPQENGQMRPYPCRESQSPSVRRHIWTAYIIAIRIFTRASIRATTGKKCLRDSKNIIKYIIY